jgi:hypothetical protein
MFYNVDIELFNTRWKLSAYDKDLYTDGNVTGKIFFETDEYIVIKLRSNNGITY